MAAPKAEAKNAGAEGALYPVIEALVERASPDEVDGFFQSLKDALLELKGPRAEQGKKVKVAIERTEELLHHLLQVREKLEEDRKAGAKSR